MSSLARRIQIGLFIRNGVRKVPVLNEETGNIRNWLWPRRKGQLAFVGNGRAIFDDTKHPTLQPIIDILAENARRSPAAA